MIPLSHLLIVGGLLFAIGITLVIIKKNAVFVLLGIEFMLNAANLNLVAFSRNDPTQLEGQLFVLFSMVLAAAQVAVALAILIMAYRYYQSSDLDKYNNLSG